MKYNSGIIWFVIVVLMLFDTSFAIRTVTYNTAGAARADIDTVLEAIGNENRGGIMRPIDILLLQEQDSVSTTTQDIVNILNTLYGSGTYDRGSVNGNTTGAGRPGIVYRTDTIQLLGEYQVNTTSTSGAARSTMRYKLRPVGYNNSDAAFYAYVSHFKAVDDSTSAARRAVEAQQVRDNSDALGNGVHIIYAGDMNLYRSSEQAWQVLTASGNGQAFDPVNRVGNWHDSSSFTGVHTQSPVTSEHFPGQVTGGVDDRFDFQLITNEFQDNEGLSYISGSYHTFGNNDTHGLNNKISAGTGASSAVLAALETTSDHLPVVADYQVPAFMQVTVDPLPQTIEIGNSYPLSVVIDNIAPATVAAEADELDYNISVTGDLVLVGGASSGTVSPLSSGHVYTLELDTASLGTKTSQLVVTSSSQGAENANYVLNLDYEVIDNNAVVTRSYNWNGFYRNDPNAVLGFEGDLDYEVHITELSDSNALMLENNDLSTRRAYLAVMDQLADGDEITVDGLARTIADPNGLTIGCAYISDSQPPYSLLGDLGPVSNPADPNWTALQQTYIYDDQSGQGYPVILYAEIDSGTVSDVNDISITTKTHTTIQWPLATTIIDCPQNPAMDLNGDCIVNLLDFEYFATWWLDGEKDAVSPGNNPAVILAGIVDGTFSSGPRAIELYVNGTVDLSDYAIERSVGGGAWADHTVLSGIYTNEYVYLISTLNSGVGKFEYVFGTEGDFANHALESTVIDCNGDDAFRLVKDAVVVDQIYWPTTTTAYEDSYMYRNDFTGPDAGWVQTNWQIPGSNFLDAKTPEEIAQLVPFGTYQYIVTNCTEQTWLDLNNDCQINLPDVLDFVNSWLACNRVPGWACDN